MTDFSRVSNTYYSIDQYNDLPTQVPASIDVSLQYPIIPKASDYTLGLVKAKVDLSTIPLTQNNIPLNFYGVQLRSPTGDLSQVFYARQINSSKNDYLYNVTSNGQFYKYIYNHLTGATTQISSVSLVTSGGLQSAYQMVIDTREYIYVAGKTSISVENDTIFIFDKNGVPTATMLFSSGIKSIAISFQNQLFVAQSTQVSVYQITSTNINPTPIADITQNHAGDNLFDVRTVCADVYTIVGYGNNNFTVYDGQYQALSDFTKPEIINMGNVSSMLGIDGGNAWCVLDTSSPVDVLWGRLQPTSPYPYQNIVSGNQIMPPPTTGTYYACPPVSFFVNNVAVLNQDGSLQQYTYNGDDTLTTYVGEIMPSSSPMTWVCCDPINYGLMVNNFGVNTLFGFNVNVNLDTYINVDTLFYINQTNTAIEQYSIQPSTHKMYAIDSTYNMYVSSQPIYPRELFTGSTIIGSGSFNNNPSYQSGLVVSLQPPDTTVKYSFVSQTTGDTFLITDTLIKRYTNPDYVLASSTPLTFSIGETYVISACELYNNSGTGYIAILAGRSPFQGEYIYIFSQADGSWTGNLIDVGFEVQYAQISATYQTPLPGPEAYDIYLLLTGGQGNTTFNLRTYGSYSAIPSFTEIASFAPPNPNGFPEYYGSTFIGQNFYVTSTQALYAPGALPTSFLKINFGPPYDSFSNGTFYDTTRTYDREFNIAGSPLFQEVYCKQDGNSTDILCYDVSETISPITPNVIIAPQALQNYISPVGLLNGKYSWQAITFPSPWPNNVYGFAFSNSENNNVYLTLNTVYEVYQGTLSGNTMTAPVLLSYLPPGSLYAQIGCLYGKTSSINHSKLYSYTITNQTALGNHDFGNNSIITSVARNNVESQFIACGTIGSTLSNHYFTPNLTRIVVSDTPNTSFALYAKNGLDIEAGAYPIYDYKVLLDSINVALALAWNDIGGTASYSEAPFLTLNYTNGLCSINYSSDYTVPVAGTILFNYPLTQLIFFPNTLDGTSTNPQMYDILLPPGSTSLIQTTKTINLFNQLDKILFVSNTLYVSNLYLGNNAVNNVIADVSLPITDPGYVLNIGETLYLQPTFIQSVEMTSNLSIQRVQLTVYYRDTIGNQYPVYLNPNTNWSAKMIFMKRN